MVDQKQSAAARIRSRARLVAQGVLSLMLVAAIFAYLFRGIDLTEGVRDALCVLTLTGTRP
jgi:type VI protein secretion system component VasF